MSDSINILGKDYLTETEAAHYACVAGDFKEWCVSRGVRSFRFMGVPVYRKADLVEKYELNGDFIRFVRRCEQAGKYLHENSRKRAKKIGVEYSLSAPEIAALIGETGGHCSVTNVIFDFTDSDGEKRPWYPSLDRIDSSKGYTRDNCRIVCVAANLAMNSWGASVLERMAEAMRSK